MGKEDVLLELRVKSARYQKGRTADETVDHHREAVRCSAQQKAGHHSDFETAEGGDDLERFAAFNRVAMFREGSGDDRSLAPQPVVVQAGSASGGVSRICSCKRAEQSAGRSRVADAFRAGRTRERIMEILKDSRIGTYGALAIVFSITVRWQCLARCRINPVLGLASSLALSRSVLVLTAFATPRAGEGLGAAFGSGLSNGAAIAVSAQMLVFASFCAWRGLAMLLSSALCVVLVRRYFVLRLGGANGDCLGAVSQIVEGLNFVILAWQPSI